ncbi:uncharacterized protein BHQ10_003891 [Talaromyces amestolkiae]|uniref:G-patch domain-containing protein n=1 Tax=Talaromyces amestolkiae TaxID=1196081 RepID=A0A364KWH4_TALAM|nr:uncharacterized protein BHQ10_003891 [Talaromyces amestolkiae]RAO67879.1 hypothetical protein BHQ10_003891 [Talaromyces amestolkiae]
MDAQAYLMRHGWSGPGNPLNPNRRPGTHSGLGLTRPLLVSRRENKIGIGKTSTKDPTNQWWLRGFEEALRGVGTDGTASPNTAVGGLAREENTLTRNGSQLYKFFVRGEVIPGTLSDKKKAVVLEVKGEISIKDKVKKEKKRKRDGEEDDESRRLRKEKKRSKKQKTESSGSATPAEQDSDSRKARKKEKKEKKSKKETSSRNDNSASDEVDTAQPTDSKERKRKKKRTEDGDQDIDADRKAEKRKKKKARLSENGEQATPDLSVEDKASMKPVEIETKKKKSKSKDKGDKEEREMKDKEKKKRKDKAG